MIVDLLLISLLLGILCWLGTSKPKQFPPGPFKWPIVGNVLQVRRWGPFLYQSMGELERRYGEVAGFFFGPKPVVLISGLEAIKEASFRDDLSGRPLRIPQIIENKRNGILTVEGDLWKEQRRFTLRHLRDFGFGKSSMEDITIEEIESVFEGIDIQLKEQPSLWSNPISVYDILGPANINVLWHIMAGHRYSFSDPLINKLTRYVKIFLAKSESGNFIQQAFPEFVTLSPMITNMFTPLDIQRKLAKFIQIEIDKHKQALDTNNPKDFMDVYLAEIEKRKNENEHGFSERQLNFIGRDLFAAGYDTTFNTITFSLLYMILYPKVQLKVQEELDYVVGKDRLPSFSDRERLPYTEATLNEIFRHSTVVPMSVPHSPLMTVKDVEFRNYIIPKGTKIFLNLYGLHHDPKIWGDPENFRPERFLNEDGKVTKHPALLPFGTGKRACLGESLARNNVYLFFVCLMQRYCMRIPENEPKPSDEPQGNITIVSKPFRVQVRRRI